MTTGAAPLRCSALVAGLGFGCATVLLTSLGWIGIAVVALPTIVVSVRAGRIDALGGYLVGFGLVWSFFIGRVIASGATQDNAGAWVAIGLVALASGASLLVVAARRGRDRVDPVA